MQPVRLIIIGAGNRGSSFAQFALAHPELATVVGVAEPRPFYRQRVADQHDIAPENVAEDWMFRRVATGMGMSTRCRRLC